MKRKIFVLLLTIVTCLVCLHFAASANNGVTWSFDDNTGTLTFSGQGKMVAGDYPEWHNYRNKATSVVIEEGVTTIAYRAFEGFRNLTSVSVPNSLQEIEGYAFKGCVMLTQFPFGDNLTLIGPSAFSGCSGMKELIIPPKVTVIYDNAFALCTGLEKVVFNTQITKIDKSAFSNCVRLTEVQLPDSLTELGNQVFSNCMALKKVSLGSGVRTVSAFNRCTSLTEITIPDNVTSIEEYAFANCTNLTKVNIGAGVAEISTSAFDHCPNLKEFSVSQANPNICSVQGVIYNKSKTRLIVIPEGYSGIYSVLPGTVEIAEYAGHQCEKITGLIIPGSVKIIEKYAFCDCTALASVSLSEGLSTIQDIGFSRCTSLTQITFPYTLTNIGPAAFMSCTQLTHITFTGRAPTMSDSAFSFVQGDAYYPGEDPTWIDYMNRRDTWHEELVRWHPVRCSGNHTEFVAKGTAATCTTEGLTEGSRCKVCGKEYTPQKKIPATGHKFGNWIQTLAATVNAPGLQKRTCSACGLEEQKVLPILAGGSEATVKPVEPTSAPTTAQPTEPLATPTAPPATEPLATEPLSTEPTSTEPETTTAPTELSDETPTIGSSDVTPEQPKKFPWVALSIGAAVLLAAAGVVIWLRIRKKI